MRTEESLFGASARKILKAGIILLADMDVGSATYHSRCRVAFGHLECCRLSNSPSYVCSSHRRQDEKGGFAYFYRWHRTCGHYVGPSLRDFLKIECLLTLAADDGFCGC